MRRLQAVPVYLVALVQWAQTMAEISDSPEALLLQQERAPSPPHLSSESPRGTFVIPKAGLCCRWPDLTRRAQVAWAGGASYTWDFCMHNWLCDAMFHCGCTWPWAGGWDNCNVHNLTGPHCPFCAATYKCVARAFAHGLHGAMPRSLQPFTWVPGFLAMGLVILALAEGLEKGSAFRRLGPGQSYAARVTVSTAAGILAWTAVYIVVGAIFYAATDYPVRSPFAMRAWPFAP